MKKIPTNNYIVVGTAHMGMDRNVLKVIAKAAKHYKAQVIHVGPLATQQEIDMWNRRVRKIKTWEKEKEERLDQMAFKFESKAEEIDEEVLELRFELNTKKSQLKSTQKKKIADKIKDRQAKKQQFAQNLANIKEVHQAEYAMLTEEIYQLEDAQQGRVEFLQEIFGDDLLFISNEEVVVPSFDEDSSIQNYLGDKYVRGAKLLGTHLSVTSISANGDKVAGAPITTRTFNVLRQMGKSHIVPHSTPQVRSFPRPGLNNAYNFWTTGSLKYHSSPNKISDAYKEASKPSCVLISINTSNQEFHCQRLRVKKDGQNSIIIHDGNVFTSDKADAKVLGSEDRAVFQTDCHTPYEHLGVVSATLALNGLHKPSVFVDGGDTCDFSSVSRHTKSIPGARENLRLSNDLNSLKRLLSTVTDPSDFPHIKKKVLIDSNHHEWVTQFVEENPTLKGICDWETLAHTLLPDWEVFIRKGGADKYFLFGDLKIKHGDNEQTVSKASSLYGNYLGGHHHSFQELGDAIFTGPGCKLGPKYLQNSATSWQNQISTITKYKNHTCKHPKTILHNEDKETSSFCYAGQIYEVKFHKYK